MQGRAQEKITLRVTCSSSSSSSMPPEKAMYRKKDAKAKKNKVDLKERESEERILAEGLRRVCRAEVGSPMAGKEKKRESYIVVYPMIAHRCGELHKHRPASASFTLTCFQWRAFRPL